MAPVPNPRWIFANYPSDLPDPDRDFKYDTSPTIDPSSTPLNGGFLTRTLWLSVDTYTRRLMRPGAAYGWTTGSVVEGFGVGEVLRSEMEGYRQGDLVYGMFKFQPYVVHTPETLAATPFPMRVLKHEYSLPLSVYLGVAGMPGKTAYYGLREIANPKAGESIFVSAASGVVGQIVCQLCKAWGLRVIGSTGSDEKLKFLTETLGIDHAFNYKKNDTAEELKKFGGIDIYWDHVGGEVLDAALMAMNRFGRVVICGQLPLLHGGNTDGLQGVKNIDCMVYKELKMQGFVYSTLEPKYADEFYATMPKLVAEGKVKYTEEVTEGLEHAIEALLKVLKGETVGKAVVKVA